MFNLLNSISNQELFEKHLYNPRIPKEINSAMRTKCTCQFHAPPPTPGGWWGNTGDLTNRGVKFPTTGAKSAVKSPLCPHPLVGDLTTPQG